MSALPRPPRVSLPVSLPSLGRPDLGPALRRAGTPPAQLLGVALIVLPAVTNALPLDGAPHTLLQVVAVVIGTVGMVVVFGGLVQRTVLSRPTAPAPDTTDQGEADETVEASPIDRALLAVPHARAVWLSLVLLSAVLLAGALWCVVLIFGQDAGTHLTDALMLVLPGLVLAATTWRARIMRTAPGPDQLSADPAFHLDQERFQS